MERTEFAVYMIPRVAVIIFKAADSTGQTCNVQILGAREVQTICILYRNESW